MGNPCGLEISIQVLLQQMMGWQRVNFPTLFIEAEPVAFSLRVVVLYGHADHGTNSGKCKFKQELATLRRWEEYLLVLLLDARVRCRGAPAVPGRSPGKRGGGVETARAVGLARLAPVRHWLADPPICLSDARNAPRRTPSWFAEGYRRRDRVCGRRWRAAAVR